MVSYRTSMQIVGDLLTATEQSGQEGIKTTALISKANLPHSRLSKMIPYSTYELPIILYSQILWECSKKLRRDVSD